MIRYVANGAVLLTGAVLLGAIMITAPDYNSVFQAFPSHASIGEIANGRMFDARFLGGRLTHRIDFEYYGRQVSRDTEGIFLIANFEVSGVTASTQLAAKWKGASGRDYAASARFEKAPKILQSLFFQPGLTSKGFVIFEVPEDEVLGGKLILSRRGVTILDSALHLETARIAPPVAVVRLDP
ncbi:hypothetical protein KUG47_08970 [Falsochrobactrum sp. TDYN1]|uniref:DUF4352 domain-containing protein n=1 Tax=Falsochrobactrum tianjinense TaxID=2706015 RepID=A0A949PNC2_9HYPH|nr:hypothetical protein [Falsochrobactrum sp. TDYN1]MBV2143629.1 hypothetical protein [Falsochrobactrum sp. TDYN1]